MPKSDFGELFGIYTVVLIFAYILGLSYYYTFATMHYQMDKRDVGGEIARRLMTITLWIFGVITNYLSAQECYDPVDLYNFRSNHIPLAVDILAVIECFMVFAVLLTSKDATRANWITFVVGLIGCVISLISSVFSIGELKIPANLLWIGHWGVGVFGFCLASVVRSMFLDIIMICGEATYKYVKLKERTPRRLEAGVGEDVPPSGGGGSSGDANSGDGNSGGGESTGDGGSNDGNIGGGA